VPVTLRPPPQRVPWDRFYEEWAPGWEQGEHVAVIKPTGGGKTTLIKAILPRRNDVVALVSKKRDETYAGFLTNDGFDRISKWPPPVTPRNRRLPRKLLLWPEAPTLADLYKNGPIFRKCLNAVYEDEGWCAVLDDMYWLAEELKLSRQISALNYQVRSIDVTLVSGIQRLAFIPKSTWNQSKHLFIAGTPDEDDLRQMRGIAKASTAELKSWTETLGEFEWLYCPQVAMKYPACIIQPPPP
jgi:energy-coupling factor transporter ATP-binding protein EcfA2